MRVVLVASGVGRIDEHEFFRRQTMAFDGNNGHLFNSYNAANKVDLGNGGLNGGIATGTAGADAFILHGSASGNDTILGFGSNDSILDDHKIYDGNSDGYIDFGDNSQLDADRTGSGNSKSGDYHVTVIGTGSDQIETIRYLGTKDSQYVYASANTRDQLLGHFTSGFDNSHGGSGGDASLAGFTYKYDDSVATGETFNFGKGATALLVDNQLGLNLGGDTISNFGSDDLLIFTAKIFDSNLNQTITFGSNHVLDVSSQAPDPQDPHGGAGGQLAFDSGVTSLKYLGEQTIGSGVNAVTYYYYGSADHIGSPLDAA